MPHPRLPGALGDNGWPFPRSKATVYETGTHTPLAISWPAKFPANRVVHDFVNFADLAPTFLEAAGVAIPRLMTARSLIAVLTSGKTGWVDPRRDHVLTGMERHAPCRGAIRGGYPMRAIRTRDFHFIRNFAADRWPAGDPPPPHATYEQLAANTFTGYADCDAGPSKAWMVTHRGDPQVKPFFELAFGMRPDRELYDLRSDPYQMRNVARDPKYADTLRRMEGDLMKELQATADARLEGRGDMFDRYEWMQMTRRK